MNVVLRGVVVYVLLLLIFRVSGKRTLSQVTTFDFVLLLIIGGATTQALLGNDFSITTAFLVILTLVVIDIGVALLKQHAPIFAKYVDGVPLVIVEDGKPLRERMRKARVGENDILQRARQLQGIERMDQIKYAVMETTGGITIIPKKKES